MKKVDAGNWKYLDGDLTVDMIKETISSYDSHVIEYAENFEWDPDMQERTSHDYLHSFIKYLKTGDHVFVAGLGTGRDALELQNRQFEVFGMDGSMSMLQVATNHGIRVPMWCQDISGVMLPEHSLDGILVESVLQHMPKKNIVTSLQKMVSWMRVDGIFFARLRLGSGKVFVVRDVVGTRYFTSYRESEINEIVGDLIGVELIEDVKIVKHRVLGRPGFASFVLRKMKS